MRKKIVAGNWKMNKGLAEGIEFANELADKLSTEKPANVTVVLNTPFIHLPAVADAVKNIEGVAAGAQNCYFEPKGAFTGEISASMVKSTGATFVVLGHSERREYFNEDNQMLAKKVDAVLAEGLTPIFCCGEDLPTREADKHVAHVSQQITESLFHLSAEVLKKVVIAYEPIWAIGTGVTASTEQTQEMHAALRKHLASKYGENVAAEISLLYGGSVKPNNAVELFACEDVDGGLIGGASLKTDDFMAIVKA